MGLSAKGKMEHPRTVKRCMDAPSYTNNDTTIMGGSRVWSAV